MACGTSIDQKTMKIISPEKFTKLPSAIIFDTDNTLYEYSPAHETALKAVFVKAKRILGCREKEFATIYNESRAEIKKRLGSVASSHSRLLYFQLAIEKITGKSNLFATLDLDQTYWRIFLDNAVLFPDVKEFISLVHQIGIKTAVVTDLTSQIQFRKLIFFGLDDFFDVMVTSEEAGADKPNEAAYLLALHKLKVVSDKCWMIGDSYNSDMVGGKNVGLTTLQKIHKGVDEKNHLHQDAIFSDFRGLIDFIVRMK